MQIDENELVECIGRIADGDERALASLCNRYSKALSGLISAIVKRKDDADDILNRTFQKFRETAGDFNPAKETVYGRLLIVARDLAVQKSLASGTDSRPEPDMGADAMASHARDMRRIRSALARVPADTRRMIEDAYLGGYSQPQIAARLGVPLRRVKMGMREGFRSLQSGLGETA